MESHYRKNSRRLIIVLVTLNLMMITATVFFLRESYSDYRRQAQITAENLSQSLEREIADTYNVSDLLLSSVADEFGFFSHDHFQYIRILNNRASQFKQFSSLCVNDAHGSVIFCSNESVFPKTDPLFNNTLLQLHQTPSNKIMISHPLQNQKSGTWYLLLAKRINNQYGSLAGTVSVTLPLEYFQNMFAKLKLGANTSIALRDAKLGLIVRHPYRGDYKQLKSLKSSNDFRDALAANPDHGVYTAEATSIDGIRRLHSYRKNSLYDFYINVGIAKNDFLTEWKHHLIQAGVLVAFFILMSLTLVRLLQASWNKQQIEEQQRMETEIVLRKLSTVAEQSPVAIVITDLFGTIEYVNPKFVQLTGYTAEEAIGKNPSILQSGETPQGIYIELWKTVLDGNVWEGDFCNKSKSGELFWEHATISPLRSEDGQITNLIAIKEDITKKIEVMNQLQQSQKMQSIGQLAGGMAHDFNNILSIINGYICLMQLETQDGDPIKEYLAFIQEASSRAGGLTHALLAFSRKQFIKPVVQNLNSVLGNIGQLLERTIRDDISYRMYFVDDPLFVNIDSIQIDHVLINIVTNAVDAMPNGGKISIVTSRRTMDQESVFSKKYGKSGEYAVIEVSDNGIGMDDETVKHIFEPFFTTKNIGKGTGLGLSMVFGIIKQHNGYIEVSSQPGEGTIFTLFLPLQQGQEKDDRDVNHTALNTLPRGDETILLAEDDSNVRKLMNTLLSNCGYNVITAKDGQDAVDKFHRYNDKIDMLMFDLFMPHKNGFEAYKEIRSIRSNIKVLFNSGYPASELSKMDQLDSNAEFLSKPVQPMALMTKIREMLN